MAFTEEKLTDFQELWEDAVSDLLAFPVHEVTSSYTTQFRVGEAARIAAAESSRQAANIAFGGVRSLLGDASFTWHPGVPPRDAFDYVLAEVTFREMTWNEYRERVERAAAHGRMLLARAIGMAQEEGLNPQSPMDGLAARAGIDRFLEEIDLAERRVREGDWTEAIHDARRAIEVCTKQAANRMTPSASDRPFGDAVEVLKVKGLIDSSTAAMLRTPGVGLFGWLSNHGSHTSDGGDSQEAGEAEARFAVDWARVTIEYLLRRLVALSNA